MILLHLETRVDVYRKRVPKLEADQRINSHIKTCMNTHPPFYIYSIDLFIDILSILSVILVLQPLRQPPTPPLLESYSMHTCLSRFTNNWKKLIFKRCYSILLNIRIIINFESMQFKNKKQWIILLMKYQWRLN